MSIKNGASEIVLVMVIVFSACLCNSCSSSSSDSNDGEDGDIDGDSETGEISESDGETAELPDDYVDYELWPSTHVIEGSEV